MKKGLAYVLAMVLMLSYIGSVPAFAAEKIVLYENDFEAVNTGDKPAGMYVLENEANRYLARIAETDGGKALFVHHAADCECGKGGGPFARLTADFTKYRDLTLSFKTKGNDATSVVTLNNTENGQIIRLFEEKADKWTTADVFLDLEKATYTISVNGKKSEDGKLDSFGMPSAAQIRFSGLEVYYDEIRLTTSGERETPYTPPEAEDAGEVFVPATAAELTKAPAGMYAVWDTDFSNATVATAKKTVIKTDDGEENPFSTATDYVEVVDIKGDRMLRFGVLDNKVHGPQVRFSLNAAAKKYVVDFAVAHKTDSGLFVDLYQAKTKVESFLSVTANTTGEENGWHYVHLEIDLENGTANGTVNGTAIEHKSFALSGPEAIELSFATSTSNNALLYVDNLKIYSAVKPVIETMFVGTKLYWENVKPKNELSSASFVNNLVAHPRVFVTDWAAMRAKADTDYYTKLWYADIKQTADHAMNAQMVEWKLNSRNNVLESARAAKVRLVALAFVGMIEQNTAYLDRAYEEALYYGSWPDWSGMNSTFVTAQIMEGYGCLYDWGYDYFTKEQKQTLIALMKKHGFPDFLYHYVNM